MEDLLIRQKVLNRSFQGHVSGFQPIAYRAIFKAARAFYSARRIVVILSLKFKTYKICLKI
jgi:hypothetical protein